MKGDLRALSRVNTTLQQNDWRKQCKHN